MNIGVMLQDVLTSMVHRPVTERYPFERQPVPDGLRGKVVWNADECIGCGRCVKDCPAEALELFILDRKAKKYVMRYHVDRCVFCAQCKRSCPTDAISLSDEQWELAALDRTTFDVYYGKDEDVQAVLAESAVSAGQGD